MTYVSASLSLNIEFWQNGRQVAYTRPFLSVTKPLLWCWRARSALQRKKQQLQAALTLAGIGASAFKFALVG
jgi:hypothetical protein